MSISFYNTLNRKQEEFVPLTPGKAGMYTCGPTVYNFATIGNFRAYMFEDLLRRALKYHDFEVTQVMNLTDVDDKTIRDSQAAGMKLNDFTEKYKKAFFKDLKTLNIEPAEQYPAATGHIREMIELVQKLLDKGYAYKAEDGSIYYSIAKFPEYGKLAKIDMDNQRAGVRIKTDEYAKDSVADFALWKAWDEADGDVVWDSPWGKGRPGWHIECSAMSMKYLGETFDIHTGGIDNMFPHHEDEIAQSEAANGKQYVRYWLHCDHLIVNGEKMSKSLGNFYTLRDLLDKGYASDEIRWVLLGTHYRKKLNFTFDAIDQARTSLQKFRDFFLRLREIDGNADSTEAGKVAEEAKEAFKNAIGDDLNISEALAAVYGLQREANRLIGEGKLGKSGAELILEQFRDFDKVLGCLNVDAAAEPEVPAEIVEMAEARRAARKAKDFAKADTLRDEITAKGYVMEDTPDGFRIKPL